MIFERFKPGSHYVGSFRLTRAAGDAAKQFQEVLPRTGIFSAVSQEIGASSVTEETCPSEVVG